MNPPARRGARSRGSARCLAADPPRAAPIGRWVAADEVANTLAYGDKRTVAAKIAYLVPERA